MNTWTHTLSLPRHFLATAIATYALVVSVGDSLTLLLHLHAGWTRSDLAFSAMLALVVTIPATFMERARRRQAEVVQG